MKHSRRDFLLTATGASALLSGKAKARSTGRGGRAGGASAGTPTNPTNLAGPLFPQQPFNSTITGMDIHVSPILNQTTDDVNLLVSGTVTITTGPQGLPTGSLTIQWMLDTSPLGPQMSAPLGTYSWDTTTATDGTHCLWMQVLDSTPSSGFAAYSLVSCRPKSVTVLNGSPAGISPSVVQTVASVPTGSASVFGAWPARPDFLTYPGSPSLVQTTVFPTTWGGQAVPPATADSRYTGGNATLLRDASLFYAEPGSSYRWSQYQNDLQFRTLRNNGTNAFPIGVVVSKFDPQIGGLNLVQAYPLMIRVNPWDGGRLNNLYTPWSEFEEIPPGATFATPGSGFLGIEVQGSLRTLLWTGAATTIFGFRADRTVLSVDFEDPGWAESDIPRTAIGTCIGFDDLGGAGDLCFDPDVPDICYVAVTLHNFIAAVNLSASVTTGGIPPMSAVIYAGADVADAYVDNATAANARFAQPSGMCIVPNSSGPDPKGTIYIADYNNNAIRKIVRTSPGVAGAVSTKMGGNLVTQPADFAAYATGFSTYTPASTTFTGSYCMGPNKLAITSDNGFVFVETWNNTIRYANLAGNLVTICGVYGSDHGSPFPDAAPSGGGAPGGFRWIDCDYAGTCGPVDDWITLNVTAATAGNDTYRGSKDGVYGNGWVGSPHGVFLKQGVPSYVLQGMGHYSWGITFARTQGRMIGNGIGSLPNSILRIAFQSGVNGSTVTDPLTLPAAYQNYASAGFESYMSGTAVVEVIVGGVGSTPMIFPFNSRPTFWSVMGSGSGGNIGGALPHDSFDALNAALPVDGNYDLHPGDPANAGTLTAYIQAGLGGTVPRPEFTGNSLRDLMYYIRFSPTQNAWPTQIAIGPTNPDTTPPVIQNVSISHIGSTLVAHWDTNKPTFGLLAVGTPNQVTITGGNQSMMYPMWAFEDFTPGVASYKTTGHSATLTNLPTGVTPLHWTITAKDIAGNSSYIVDQTVA